MIYDFIEIDYDSDISLYIQLYQQLKAAIDNSLIEVETKLPSIRVAANELKLSRTTIENAYNRLCSEMYLENRPQKGFFVKKPIIKTYKQLANNEKEILYDFSSSQIDVLAADIPIWNKYIRNILKHEKTLATYGEPQGELSLREAISTYVYTTRSVISTSDNIIIGAGVQQLISLLCCIMPKAKVAIDYPGFKHAEQIFKDYGFETIFINDPKHPEINLDNVKADIYYYIPSLKAKMSASLIHENRQSLIKWLNASDKHYIIEDDFNGELKFKSKAIASLQSLNNQRIIYLGSFSKLLLPSVRIAYGIFPNDLLAKYQKIKTYYNQTASKVEQLALAEYIHDGYLEKHLRRLKKLYLAKSNELIRIIEKEFPNAKIQLLESSLSIIFELDTNLDEESLKELLINNGIAIEGLDNNKLKLNFAGIQIDKMEEAIKLISYITKKR